MVIQNTVSATSFDSGTVNTIILVLMIPFMWSMNKRLGQVREKFDRQQGVLFGDEGEGGLVRDFRVVRRRQHRHSSLISALLLKTGLEVPDTESDD